MRERILAHRGLSRNPQEQNTLESIKLAFVEGFGVEIDVRDQLGQLIVSHDPPSNQVYPTLKDVSKLSFSTPTTVSPLLALNVKSDGIVKLLKSNPVDLSKLRHFWFDMSFPESYLMRKAGYEVAHRLSEFERFDQSYLSETMAEFVWLDSFQQQWWDSGIVAKLSKMGVSTIIVSPELHGREPESTWEQFAEMLQAGLDVYMCTDHPFAVEELL